MKKKFRVKLKNWFWKFIDKCLKYDIKIGFWFK